METVTVLYKYVDGAHFFVSGDEKAAGLCVAHKDLAKAMEAVSGALITMFKENHGVDIIAAYPLMFAPPPAAATPPMVESPIAVPEEVADSAFPWVLSEETYEAA